MQQVVHKKIVMSTSRLLGFLLTFLPAYSDLPVHCMYEDIIGTWELSSEQLNSNVALTCGSSLPNRNLNNLLVMNVCRGKIIQFLGYRVLDHK